MSATTPEGLPRYSRRLHRWFAIYLERYFARHFTGVRLSRAGAPPRSGDEPLVVYSNHPSWWDPLVFVLLGWRLFPERQGYGAMDAVALQHYGIFRRLGVFGVEPGTTRGTRDFLRIGRTVLERPRSTLWLTAQGELTDPRARPLVLRAGLAHLVRRLRGVTVVPLALEYPFWNERRPEALARFGAAIHVEDGASAPASAWHELFTARLEETQDALAREAARRCADPFSSLLAGRVGAGGIYDGWRRLRALASGERFEPAHAALVRTTPAARARSAR